MVRGSVYDHFLVNRPHMLLFCRIEKDANTLFADFLCSLSRNHAASVDVAPMHHRLWGTWDFEDGCDWWSANGDDIVPTALASDAWTRAVFYRDPLDRFLSAYLSKCVPGHDVDTRMCGNVFPGAGYQPSFAFLVNAAGRDGWAPPATEDGNHWKLQSRFCDGTLLRPREHYHLVMPLDRYTTGAHTAEMMRRAGWTHPSDEPIYRYYFGQEQHDDGRHATDADRRRRQYYTSAAMVTSVLRFTAPDYQAFNISVPAWASNMVGDNALCALGLWRDGADFVCPSPPTAPPPSPSPSSPPAPPSPAAPPELPVRHRRRLQTRLSRRQHGHRRDCHRRRRHPRCRRHSRRLAAEYTPPSLSSPTPQRRSRTATPPRAARRCFSRASSQRAREAAGCWRCSGFGARCAGDAAAGRA